MLEGLTSSIRDCTSDIVGIFGAGKMELQAQVRAYDLLDDLSGLDRMPVEDSALYDSVRDFCDTYDAFRVTLEKAYDGNGLTDEAMAVLAPLNDAFEKAHLEAVAAAELHETAKEVFDIWQTSGFLARRMALCRLRKRAGFRLESHRIGNFVAKTFDLMNEAQARCARTQQAVFAADVRYKIRPHIYDDIRTALGSFYAAEDASR